MVYHFLDALWKDMKKGKIFRLCIIFQHNILRIATFYFQIIGGKSEQQYFRKSLYWGATPEPKIF